VFVWREKIEGAASVDDNKKAIEKIDSFMLMSSFQCKAR
jgi:hypothetical protein